MKQLNKLLHFIMVLYRQRSIMSTLVIQDFKSRYLSTYIGLPWAFIQPSMYVIVIWFAFSTGLRGSQSSNEEIPFAAFLLSGLIPWMFISQTMSISCNSIMQYSYLIKKTNFPVSMIPVIKILSGLIVHAILVFFMIILFVFYYGLTPNIYWLQIIYYQFVMLFLLTGIAWFVASVNVIIRDMAQFINVLVTMLFWATPIIWPYSKLTGNFRYVALLNPFFYITEGYRFTFLKKIWFFEYVEMNVFFWTVSITIFVVGIITFQKLKPTFGDVL